MNTPRKFRFLFGPIPSRRLGYSLGVDLFETKVCTHNCPYCECGPTRQLVTERREFVPYDDVAAELRAFLPHAGLDYVTFSGNGEPTLYSRLGDLVRLIRSLCDTPVAIITNSALVMRADVRAELALADVVMPSLDAVSQDAMDRINMADPSITAEDMIEGLVEFRREFSGRIDLEIFFCKGLNDDPHEVDLLASAARRIGADRVQLNTVDRPPAMKLAQPLSRAEMESIAAHFAGLPVEVIGRFAHDDAPVATGDPRAQILAMIERRAVDEADLIRALGLAEPDARAVLDSLVAEGRIRRVEFDGRPHYRRETAAVRGK